MSRPSRFSLPLGSLVLLVLMPCLLLTTALFGGAVYRAIYGIIMTGFDQKLHAVSTVTGAFIDGDEHQELVRPREISALTPAPTGDALLGVDRVTGRAYRVDTTRGGALELGPLPQGTVALASDAGGERLWAATAEPALYRASGPGAAFEFIANLDSAPAGLVHDALEDALYAGGETLFQIDPETGETRSVAIAGLPEPVRAPALDPTTRTLYLLAGAPERLTAVKLTEITAQAIGPVRGGDTEGATAADQPTTIHALAFAQGTLFGAADRLVRFDLDDGTFTGAGMASRFRSEESAEYLRYVAPMRRVMARNDITYLYTETVDLGGRLTYWIDASAGDEHSQIGSTEVIPDEEIPAMERAMVDGAVRLSALEDWGDWGLLKTADAPIYDRDGRVVALAAADIDISVLLEKTRLALVKVGAVAAVTLLLGALVSLFISRRLVAPLMEVKEGALQLATGRYRHRIPDQRLVELRQLAGSFNDMSEALGTTIDELARSNETLERERLRKALEGALLGSPKQALPEPPFIVRDDGERTTPSGWAQLRTLQGQLLLVWLVTPSSGAALHDLKLRHEIDAFAGPLLARHHAEPEVIAELLIGAFPRIDMLVQIDEAGRRLHCMPRRPGRLALGDARTSTRLVDLATTQMLTLRDDEWIVISEGDPAIAARHLEPLLRGESPEAAASTPTGLTIGLRGVPQSPGAPSATADAPLAPSVS